ncbi:MAG: hypothetical protein RSF78_10955 [Bacteroidales bacterium]
MTKMLYQKPDLQIIEIETEEVIAVSVEKEPEWEDNYVPGLGNQSNTRQYQNTMGSWNENSL